MEVPDIEKKNIKRILEIINYLDDGCFFTLRKLLKSEIRETFEDALFDIEKLQDFLEILKDDGICEACEESTAGFMIGESSWAIDGNYCARCASKKRG